MISFMMVHTCTMSVACVSCHIISNDPFQMIHFNFKNFIIFHLINWKQNKMKFELEFECKSYDQLNWTISIHVTELTACYKWKLKLFFILLSIWNYEILSHADIIYLKQIE